MVCDSCQLKVGNKSSSSNEKWKEATRSSLKVIGKTNKALNAKKVSSQYIPNESVCRICKSKVLLNMFYCNDCAYKKGICTMCGKKVMDTSMHKMSLT